MAQARNVGAFALSTLLNQHQAALFGTSERVGRVTCTDNSVLNKYENIKLI